MGQSRWQREGGGLFHLLAAVLSASLFLVGCTSSWDYVERAKGQGKVAVLRDPGQVLPAFGEDYSSILKANAQVSTKVQINGESQSTQNLRELFDRQDQGNAQLRNFLVMAYALYINGEFEENPQLRDKARERWSEAILGLQQRAFTSRELGLARDIQMGRVKNDVDQAIRGTVGLGLETPSSKEIKAKLEPQVEKLDMMELNAGLPESDVTILGKGVLAFWQKDYSRVIATIPPLRTTSPEQLYLLTAAYVKATRGADADKTMTLLASARETANLADTTAALQGDKTLRARALNLLGNIQARLETNAQNIARTNFERAVTLDPKYATAWFNLGCSWCELASPNPKTNSTEIVNSIICLNNYRLLLTISSKAAVQEAAEDPDHAFANLFIAYKADKDSEADVKAKLKAVLDNTDLTTEPPHGPAGEPAKPPAGEPAKPPTGEPAKPPAGEPAKPPHQKASPK